MNDDFNVIAALDLEPIKVKLMDEESGHAWSLERANAVELEYRRFLYLMKKFPQEPAIPLQDVDQFWHCHILDTMKYAADCDAVFGYFLHHFPYIGMRGKDDREAHRRLTERTREHYAATFSDDYVRSSARTWLSATPGMTQPWTAGAPRAAWCTAVPDKSALQPDSMPGMTTARDAEPPRAAWCLADPGDAAPQAGAAPARFSPSGRGWPIVPEHRPL